MDVSGAGLTSGGLAVIFGVVALLLRHASKAPKTQVVFMLIAGFGVGGMLAAFLTRLGRFATHAATVGTAKVFGVAVPAVLVIGLLGWLILEMEPKNKTPHKTAVWVALILPAVLAVAGGAWAQLGQHSGAFLTDLGQKSTELVQSLAQSW